MSDPIEIKWRAGSRFKTNPVKAFEELERIKSRNGGEIDANTVVEAARSKRSPIHRDFEWDDAIAAHEHRLETARKMVRSIEIVRKEAPNISARAYEVTVSRESTLESPKKAYRSTEEILSDPVARDELLGRAVRDAISFRKRYAALSELSQVFQAVEKFIRSASV